MIGAAVLNATMRNKSQHISEARKQSALMPGFGSGQAQNIYGNEFTGFTEFATMWSRVRVFAWGWEPLSTRPEGWRLGEMCGSGSSVQ